MTLKAKRECVTSYTSTEIVFPVVSDIASLLTLYTRLNIEQKQ